jgi:threonine dehydrogenase-like Zn-dependent dehydrogenase
MRASVFHGPRDIRVETVPDPSIRDSRDAIVRVRRATICGSDLWFYRGIWDWKPGYRTGHEFVGVVEEVGPAVTNVRPGQAVIAPFTWSDGVCEFCRAGLTTSCVRGGVWGSTNDGGQGELVRVPQADGTLVRMPESIADDPVRSGSVALLTDVVPTGHHAAVSAGVAPGSTAVVIGDGAVGLCGVMGARRLGAERIIASGHHASRLELARHFGATDIVDGSDDTVARILDLTDGGAPSVLECVGTQASMELAVDVVRPGGRVGYVGVPAGVERVPIDRMFQKNVRLAGGVAPARAYIPELLDEFQAGRFDPAPLLDLHVPLDDVPDGYAAMDERKALKVLVEIS